MLRHVSSIYTIALFSALLSGFLFSASGHAQDDELVVLKWSPQTGYGYTYDIKSVASYRGDELVRQYSAKTWCVGATSELESGPVRYDFELQPFEVNENDPLGYRFDDAQFDSFSYSVLENGTMFCDGYALFPPVMNTLIFADYPVGEGMSWETESVNVLQGRTSQPYIFDIHSTFVKTREYMGDNCVVIDSMYSTILAQNIIFYEPDFGFEEGENSAGDGSGAVIGSVTQGSEVESAGLEVGDIITHAEGQEIRGWAGLRECYHYVYIGNPVEFTVMRGDVEFNIEILPRLVPYAYEVIFGGAKSTVIFSLDRGIPLKIDFEFDDLHTSVYKMNDDLIVEFYLEKKWEIEFVRQSIPTNR